jgi:hypothetical protein
MKALQHPARFRTTAVHCILFVAVTGEERGWRLPEKIYLIALPNS